MAKIAVLGYGTVGSGVVEILDANAESISKKAGQPIEVKSVLDLRDFPGDPIQEKIVHDIDLIINDDEIDVVIEVIVLYYSCRRCSYHQLEKCSGGFQRYHQRGI